MLEALLRIALDVDRRAGIARLLALYKDRPVALEDAASITTQPNAVIAWSVRNHRLSGLECHSRCLGRRCLGWGRGRGSRGTHVEFEGRS